MNDEKIWLETEDGQKLFIIKSEKIDMQEELNKTIENLYQELQGKDNIINEIKEYVDDELDEYENNEDYEIDSYNMECLQDKIQTLIFEYDEGIRK